MCEGGGDDGVGAQCLTEAVYTCSTNKFLKKRLRTVKYYFLIAMYSPLGDMEVFERFKFFRPMGSLAS